MDENKFLNADKVIIQLLTQIFVMLHINEKRLDKLCGPIDSELFGRADKTARDLYQKILNASSFDNQKQN
jgi:hypothetical protein